MFRLLVTALALLFAMAAAASAQTVEINAITPDGVGKALGTAKLSQSGSGLTVKLEVTGIPDGEHGFHVHEKGNCGAGMKDGKKAAGIAAGEHYDPGGTKSHKGPDADGHKGDLPKLTATNGKIDQTVSLKGLKLAEVAGRSLMIHEAGDNYSDNPENGGGKGRIACGAIPK